VVRQSTHELPAAGSASRLGRVVATALLTAPLALGLAGAGAPAHAAETQRTLLLLPIASGTPGQERSARALGLIIEEWLGSLPGARVVGGAIPNE